MGDVEDTVSYNGNAQFGSQDGVSKGAIAPFADAPEGGEVALGLGEQSGVWQKEESLYWYTKSAETLVFLRFDYP
ncbi:MAG: hypothetical protein J6A56_05905 [Clostridia bacterium]|nr:hypothetical protein [Clostridia bacterium]